VTFDDIGYGILAQADFAADQAITASLCDKRYHLRGEPVRFRVTVAVYLTLQELIDS
jgi:hypothetical protein